MKVYIDGKFYDKQDAKISVYDHGLLYGDGVFEGIRVYHGKVFKLKAHVERLFDSAKAIHLLPPWTQREVASAILETVRLSPGCEYLRPIITRGVGNLGIDARKCERPTLIVIADTISLYPKESYELGLNVATVATVRNHPAATNARVKSLNYLNNVMARMEATLSNCQEALMLNHKGDISECSGDNIFLIKRGELYTPSIDAGILDGITRRIVINIALQHGIKVHECTLSRFDVFTADECFLTGTAAEIVPVATVDGRSIGTGKAGPVTKKLWAAYREMTNEPEDKVSSMRGNVMSTAAQLVYEKALLLSDEERKQVVKDLLDTFEYNDSEFEIDDELAIELKCRLQDMNSGKEPGIPWDEARREIFKD